MLRAGLIVVLCLAFPSLIMAGETVKQREQRELLQKLLETKLYEVNQKLESLGSKAVSIKEDWRQEYKSRLEEVAQKRQTATKKLEEMKSADPYDWDRFKTEASFAIDDLNRLYDTMSSLLKK